MKRQMHWLIIGLMGLLTSGAVAQGGGNGACCITAANGESHCVMINEATCAEQQGQWHGDGSHCADIDCGGGGIGACCLGDDCIMLGHQNCMAKGGLWLGPGVPCAKVECAGAGIGACCIQIPTGM